MMPIFALDRTVRRVALTAVVTLSACDRGGTDVPSGGDYLATLRPSGAQGAAAFELTGPGIESITGADGVTLYSQPTGQTTRVVAIRQTAGPIAFTVRTAAGQAPPTARVIEVVNGENLPQTTALYQLAFSRGDQ